LLLLAAAAAAGCAETAPGRVGEHPPPPVAAVDHIYPELWPAPVNLDETPGPDGLQASVLFFLRARPLPVTVSGTVELLLFDGRVGRAEAETVKPLLVCTFRGDDLPKHLRRMRAGWGYSFVLPWGKQAPAAPAVTLAVRYLPPEGPPLYSQPVSIPLAPH